MCSCEFVRVTVAYSSLVEFHRGLKLNRFGYTDPTRYDHPFYPFLLPTLSHYTVTETGTWMDSYLPSSSVLGPRSSLKDEGRWW